MTEKEEAVRLAHAVLDKPHIDPDGDISMLARQFLRAREEIDAMREALEPFARVAAADIGTEEADRDKFIPISISRNRAPLLTVGDMRRARAVLANFTVPQVAEKDATIARLSAELAGMTANVELVNKNASRLLAGMLEFEADRDRLSAKVEAAREALKAADRFITNGIELGFIRMPDADTPDPAHETPELIRAVLASYTVPEVPRK